MRPAILPVCPLFSSGPCAKRLGWSPDVLSEAVVGRSHRSAVGKARLGELIERSRRLLGLPDDWRIGVVPASDTGAVEMALWSMLGARGVDMLAWESFGKGWVTDVTRQLKLDDVRLIEADYGLLPDLQQVDFSRDVVFTWNGTTSGVSVPDGDWLADDRQGLVICDATSAAFAYDLPWRKIDVATYSWQKVMGGEAAHGMLILGPRAVERLEHYTPPWPLPKIFRLTRNGRLIESIFSGETINTPSMLCVEDALDGLRWAEDIGGRSALLRRVEENVRTVDEWVRRTPWISYLARHPATRSRTSVCLTFADVVAIEAGKDGGRQFAASIVKLLDEAGAAHDIGAYRDAPPGLRLWTGATVDVSDLEALFPWLDWAFAEVINRQK